MNTPLRFEGKDLRCFTEDGHQLFVLSDFSRILGCTTDFVKDRVNQSDRLLRKIDSGRKAYVLKQGVFEMLLRELDGDLEWGSVNHDYKRVLSRFIPWYDRNFLTPRTPQNGSKDLLTQQFERFGTLPELDLSNEEGPVIPEHNEEVPMQEPVSQTASSLNEVIPFQYSDGSNIRVIRGEDGEPWFIGQDVCGPLGYTNAPKAVRDHCKYPKLLRQNESFILEINPRGITIIPESDLYRLIMRSKMPEADKFQDWVTEEVLPRIRKSGGYVMGEEKIETEEELTLRVMQMLKQKIELQRQQLTDQAPKVAVADAFFGSKNSWSMAQVAKGLFQKKGIEIGRNRLLKVLREQGVLRQNNEPYQEYVDRGYFVTSFVNPHSDRIVSLTKATGKGAKFILELLQRIRYGRAS